MAKKLRKFKLSEKRQEYTDGRKGILLGEPLRPNQRALDREAERVASMVEKMNRDVSKSIESLFSSELAKESVAQDASIASQATILLNAKAREWQKKFNDFANFFGKDMADRQNKYVTKDMGNSLEKLSGGMSIKTDTLSDRTKDIIKASSEQSSSLIKSIGTDYMSSVKEAVMRSITDSSSSFESLKESINQALTGRFKVYKNKAKNTALDQTRKTYQALSDQRMRDVGVTKYRWQHSGGSQQPRSYHRDELNGQIFDLNDPPVIDKKTGERGHPGDAINCKCIKIPIIEFGGD
jgi:uncharacterized protein with gpF-like domain